MHRKLQKGASGAPNWRNQDPEVITWKYFTKWISAFQTPLVINFLLKNTGFKKAQCICRTIHGQIHRRWGSCGHILKTSQAGSSCQFISSVPRVLILPTCPGGGWREDVRRAELLLLTCHNFNSKEKLTVKSTECWLSVILCSEQQRVPEVSYEQVISNTNYTSRFHRSHHDSWDRRQKGKDSCPSGWLTTGT